MTVEDKPIKANCLEMLNLDEEAIITEYNPRAIYMIRPQSITYRGYLLTITSDPPDHWVGIISYNGQYIDAWQYPSWDFKKLIASFVRYVKFENVNEALDMNADEREYGLSLNENT